MKNNQKLTNASLPKTNKLSGIFKKYTNQLKPSVKNNVEKLHCNNISTKSKGFTLVELIIVVTILGILATIAFISFQGYTKSARDGNRLSVLTNINKGIEIYLVQTGKVPEPEGTILSGSLNGIQLNRVGVIGDNISRLIKSNKTPTDPISSNNFLYGISSDNKYYQIGTTLENLETNTNIIKNTYADNGSYRAKVVGNYKYPLKLGNKLYSLPSLLFTGTGGDLSLTGNAYFVIDKGLNIPYHPEGTLNNTRTTTEILKDITGSGGLSLTGVNIPTVTSDEFKNSGYDLGDLTKLGITDKDQLGQIIYGNGYLTDKSLGAINGGNSGGGTTPPSNSCASPTPSGAGIATTTVGSPTSVNQSWVKGSSNCGFTCTSGYTGSNCETPPTCTSWTYSSWGACQPSNTQTRTVLTSSPSNCTLGSPVLSQSCTYSPYAGNCDGVSSSVGMIYTDGNGTEIGRVNNDGTIKSGDPNSLTCDGNIVVCSGNKTGYVLQACNVGVSVSTVAGTGSSNYGKYFQWGENVAWDNSSSAGSANNCTWNRDTQSCGASAVSGWLTSVSDTTSGGSDRWYDYGDTRGPCPSTYKVPSSGDWTNIISYGGWGTNGTNLSNSLKLPFAGDRFWGGGSIENQGGGGYYWSSSPISNNDANRLIFTSSIITPANSNFRIYGYSLRCIKN